MMSDWTNLDEIMQDLSLAQGYAVPARLETVASVGPPPLLVQDEEGSVEQSYYESYCVGGGDFAAPDYSQIKTMLDLVKIDEKDDVPLLSSEFTLLSSDSSDSSEFVPRRTKEKIKINVALSPNTTAKEAKLAARRPVPKEVIPKMFRKKSLSLTDVRNENVSPTLSSQTSSSEKMKHYTPSVHADVYYSKYLQKSMLKEQIAEDIWVKAENQMKEIEKRQRLKAVLRTPEERGNTASHDVSRVTADVLLPEHRHLQSDDCMVCIVAAKHGYYF